MLDRLHDRLRDLLDLRVGRFENGGHVLASATPRLHEKALLVPAA